MNPVYAYALGSTALLTVIATVVVYLIPARPRGLHDLLSYMSALAAGCLLGDAVVYLLPKAAAHGWTVATTLAVLSGILTMLVIEQMITWDEIKKSRRRSKKVHAAVSNTIGFTLQNLIDGMVISAAYLLSIPGGIATTIAIVIHQIPQEISNNVILMRAGVPTVLANRIGALSVCTAFIGAVVGLFLPAIVERANLNYIAPVTAGIFLYIALAQLVPDMLAGRTFRKDVIQLLLLVFGVALIAAVKYSKELLGALD